MIGSTWDLVSASRLSRALRTASRFFISNAHAIAQLTSNCSINATEWAWFKARRHGRADERLAGDCDRGTTKLAGMHRLAATTRGNTYGCRRIGRNWPSHSGKQPWADRDHSQQRGLYWCLGCRPRWRNGIRGIRFRVCERHICKCDEWWNGSTSICIGWYFALPVHVSWPWTRRIWRMC